MKHPAVVTSLLLSFLLPLYAGAAQEAEPASDKDKPIIRVGDRDVTRGRLLSFLVARVGSGGLEALTNQALIRQDAQRVGATVSDADVSSRRLTVLKRLGGPISYQRFLDQAGITDPLYRTQIHYNVLAERTASRRYPVPLAELNRVSIRVIMAKDLDTAKRIIEELKRTRGESFEAIARSNFSVDKRLRASGGVVSKKPMMRIDNPVLFKAVEKLRAGQHLDQPLVPSEGAKPLVLMLDERFGPGTMTPAEREAAISRLSALKVSDLLEALRQAARLQDLVSLGELEKDEPSIPKSAIVRRVNGEAITRGQLLGRLLAYDGEAALAALVNLEMLETEAKRKSVKLDEKQVDARYQQVVEQAGGKPKFKETLQQSGLTEEYYRQQLRAEMLTQAVAKKKWPVKARDLVRLKFRYIRVDSEKKARTVVSNLKRGVSFDILAKRPMVSLDAQATGGFVGDGKPIFRIDSPALFKGVSKLRLREGKYNRTPARSGKYYLIFRLEKRLLPNTLTKSQRGRIIKRIHDYRASRLLDSLRTRAEIRYFSTVRALIAEFKSA